MASIKRRTRGGAAPAVDSTAAGQKPVEDGAQEPGTAAEQPGLLTPESKPVVRIPSVESEWP